MPTRESRHGRVLLTAALLVSAACYSGDVAVIPPPSPGFIHATVVVTAGSHDDSAFTDQLGWHGVVQGATVTISPNDTTLPPVRQLVADSLGRVNIDSLEQGIYRFEVQRVLTDAERSRLPAGSDLLGFARRMTMTLTDRDVQVAIPSYGSRQRGLVFSEWSFVPGLLPGVTDYVLGGFLELYNNGDTTAYVDGLIIVQGVAQTIETQAESCAQTATLFFDSLGVWARKFDQFPGRGHDYPVAPGKTVVIATDAIDHRPIIADGLDLRTANFEFSGPTDVDNPDVPNMIDRGLFADFSGHGTFMGGGEGVLALTSALDLDALPRRLDLTGHEYRRVPRERLLDVMVFRAYRSPKYTLCSRLADPAIIHDQGNLDYAADPNYGFTHSVNRRVLLEHSGRKVLDDTRSGTTDLLVAPRTPGWIP